MPQGRVFSSRCRMMTIESPPAQETITATRASAATWIRVGLAVALLAASGAVRYWQSRGVDDALRQGRKSPFPLKTIPTTLGDWVGTEEVLDPQIAQATGCSDYVFRTYSNEKTGAKIGLILIYGPANDVFIHAPEQCYPSAGYSMTEGPEPRSVAVGSTTIPFSSMVFTKGEGGQTERQEVYYTWRYYGQWTPTMVLKKRIERIPGMFKVHLSRQVREHELRGVGNPCESFLAELMPELERRLAESAQKSQAATPPSQTQSRSVATTR